MKLYFIDIYNFIVLKMDYIVVLTNICTYAFITFLFVFLVSKIKFIEPIIVSIDGNIGSGKSTLVHILKNRMSNNNAFLFLPEPVDEWLSITDNGDNILDRFYNDKKRWSYTFQNFAFITRTFILTKSIKNNKTSLFEKRKIIFTERSTETDKNVFAKMLYDDQYIDTLEYNIYNYWYNKLFNKECIHNVIYLRTKPDIAFERIKKRGRNEESTIPIEYIRKVHDYHDQWLTGSSTDTNICYIDVNEDFEENYENRELLISKIVKFSTSLQRRL